MEKAKPCDMSCSTCANRDDGFECMGCAMNGPPDSIEDYYRSNCWTESYDALEARADREIEKLHTEVDKLKKAQTALECPTCGTHVYELLHTPNNNKGQCIACWGNTADRLKLVVFELLDVVTMTRSACSSLMSEVTGKCAADWGLVNGALGAATAATKKAEANVYMGSASDQSG